MSDTFTCRMCDRVFLNPQGRASHERHHKRIARRQQQAMRRKLGTIADIVFKSKRTT